MMKMNKGKISVIIPVYNVEKYLKKCVNSVIVQTYQDLQIILVDDGSTDSSPVICDEYAEKYSRIHVIHKKNGGLSSARNTGLELASGDYITFLDSDDYVSPTCYEELYCAVQGRTDVIACTCFRRVDESGKIYERKDPHNEPGTTSNVEYLRELLLHIGDVSVCTKLFPRQMLKNKCFDETKLNEDLLFMTELISDIKKIIYTGKVGYYYLLRKNSTSSGYGKAVEDMALNAIAVNKLVQRKFPELSEEGSRFSLFQNMAYLLLVPKNLRNADNRKYIESLAYIKKNFLKLGLKNRYLSVKNKLIIVALTIYPEIVIKIFQRKHSI